MAVPSSQLMMTSLKLLPACLEPLVFKMLAYFSVVGFQAFCSLDGIRRLDWNWWNALNKRTLNKRARSTEHARSWTSASQDLASAMSWRWLEKLKALNKCQMLRQADPRYACCKMQGSVQFLLRWVVSLHSAAGARCHASIKNNWQDPTS